MQFTPKYWWFELVIICNKMIMTGALSIVEPGSPMQLVLATLVMLSFTLITLKLAPYKSSADDWMTFMVSLVVACNTQAGFVLLMDIDTQKFNPDVIDVILMILNVGILVVQVFTMILIKRGVWNRVKRRTIITPVEEDSDTVERLMSSFVDSESNLKEDFEKRKKRHSVNLQQRIAARIKIKKTKALTKAKVFEGINVEAIDKVLDKMSYERYEKGDTLFQQGDIANRFSIVVSGTCSVTQDGVIVGTLKALDIMGESALSGGTRSASVTATSTVHTLELSSAGFAELVEQGVIAKEVLGRVQEVQKERKDISEAILSSD